MPIASGAAGRVEVGADTSTTWTPDGQKRKSRPVNRNYDSYLLRYQEQKMKNKTDLLQDVQENTDLSEHKNEEVKEESAQTNERRSSCQDQTSDKPARGDRSKTSKMCVLL